MQNFEDHHFTDTHDTPPPDLGARVRRLRGERGLIAVDVAAKAGISPSFLSQIERGVAVPSIKVLRQLALVLEVTMGALLDDTDVLSERTHRSRHDQRRARPEVVRAHERKILRRASGPAYELLSPDLTGQIEFIWVELAPGQVSMESAHDGEEQIVVLTGEVAFDVGGEEFRLSSGDSFRFDPLLPHRSRNPTDAAASFVAALTPPSF